MLPYLVAVLVPVLSVLEMGFWILLTYLIYLPLFNAV